MTWSLWYTMLIWITVDVFYRSTTCKDLDMMKGEGDTRVGIFCKLIVQVYMLHDLSNWFNQELIYLRNEKPTSQKKRDFIGELWAQISKIFQKPSEKNKISIICKNSAIPWLCGFQIICKFLLFNANILIILQPIN